MAKGKSGGGLVVCTYCGERKKPGEPCPNSTKHPKYPMYWECPTCHVAVRVRELCQACLQKKQGKLPQCLACDNPLPLGQTTCPVCGWNSSKHRCPTCDHWLEANVMHCPYCTEECPKHHKRFPRGQKCPECAESASYKLDAVRDEDDERQEWELLVRFLRTVGTCEPQGREASVWFFDPIQATRPAFTIQPQGTVARAPYREEDRTVRFSLADSEDGNVGVSSCEVFLPGKPTRYQADPVGPYDNPWKTLWS